LLAHLPGLVAVTCPSTNSYDRLRPGMWSGAVRGWGRSNREAAVRVPLCKGGAVTHIEYRCADATCNPYLALGAIVAANITAMLIQSLSAKLGLATGRNLPEVCRDTFPRRVNVGLWVQAECVAIATDLAEVIGGAVALYLLFGLPLPIGGLVTGVVAFGLLALQERGHRPFERAVAGLFPVIVIGFVMVRKNVET